MFIFKGLTREWACSPISTTGRNWLFDIGDQVRVRNMPEDCHFRVVNKCENLAFPHYLVADGDNELRVCQLELMPVK